MPKPETICTLDLGSSQVVAAVGKYNPQDNILEVIAGARRSCRGLKGGVVVDIAETSHAIEKVVEEVESQTNEVINKLYIGIRGSHIQTSNNRGSVSISRSDKTLIPDDVDTAIENAQLTLRISPEREIIDIITQGYSADGQEGIRNPIGMEAHFLEVDTHIVTASITHLNNICKAVSGAGFEIERLIYGLLATAEMVTTQESKDLGCVVIDFGGQTTGLVIYHDGYIRLSKELPLLGSDLITRDISHALRTSFEQAENIKRQYGITESSLLKEDCEFEYIGLDGRTKYRDTRKRLTNIISPRVEEIFTTINDEIQKSPYADLIIAGGAILTGGGAALEGCREACEKMLNLPTSIGLPHNVSEKGEIVFNLTYTGAISLMRYRSNERYYYWHRPVSFLGRLRKWLERK